MTLGTERNQKFIPMCTNRSYHWIRVF